MIVEVGSPAVLVDGVPTLWHLPAGDRPERGPSPTLCGLAGNEFVYRSFVRRRRLCAVCRARAPRRHYALEPEPPARRAFEYEPPGRAWPPRASIAAERADVGKGAWL